MAGFETPSPFRPLGREDPREVAGYRLMARLGSGGMGTVYLSYTRGGQPVALKLVRNEFAEDPDFRRRFEQEVRAARQVHGVYTVPVLDSNTEGAAPWLATAYVPGMPLSEAVRDHGPLPLATVLLLMGGVAEALSSIHAAGIVHRDLKPGNVLLAPDGPKVIDFGIARAADATALTGTDVRVGTPSYMAPEQITGAPVGPATDVFTLGLVTYYAATGGHPFGEGAAHAVMYRAVQDEPDLGAVPPEVAGLIRACLAKAPEARPTPGQVIEACRRLSPGRTLQRAESWLPPPVAAAVGQRAATPSVATPPPVPAPPAAAPARGGRRTAVAMAATAVVAAIVGGVLATQLLDGGDRETPDAADADTPTTTPPDTAPPSEGAPPPDEATGEPSATASRQPPPDTDPDAPYWESLSDAELTIRAPRYREDVDVFAGECHGAQVTVVSLERVEVFNDIGYGSFDHLGESTGLEYLFCDQENASDDGISFDPDTFAGTVDDPDVSAEECYTAAHESPLPNPVPPDDVLQGHSIHEGMGICTENPDASVTLLWIDRVETNPTNRDLPTYFVTATQWQPNG
ncbi:serine/threonine-protein kinase [Streptomyces avicenniae]|uniref:serine/threonine-protein kinase n=1 Tax=Streptomyces avicenniae TaxID=500153 RepID=UPI00069AA538|nr:serine/threonine-protein kinase [Streptomyces avicenniae]